MNHLHCDMIMKCTDLRPRKNHRIRSKVEDTVTADTERKKLQVIETRERLTKLSSDYDRHITEIKQKMKEYQQIVESIDLMIRIVRLEKHQLKVQLKEKERKYCQASGLESTKEEEISPQTFLGACKVS